jgi:hypothetical protein
VTIGKSLTSLGKYAFYNCPWIKSVTCKAEVPPTMESTGYYYSCFETLVYRSAKLYVPEPSIEAYKATSDWKRFTTILAMENEIAGDVNDDGEVSIADINSLIDMILNNNQDQRGDVNGDGEVTIADINALIDIILG